MKERQARLSQRPQLATCSVSLGKYVLLSCPRPEEGRLKLTQHNLAPKEQKFPQVTA